MLLYLDTSAFIPLVLDEPSSAVCRRLWVESAAVCSSALLPVEAAATLARAGRMGRLSVAQRDACLDSAAELVDQMSLLAVSPLVLSKAADLAVHLGLRGYDAVHAASAMTVLSDRTIAAAGDGELLAAWRAVGLATVSTVTL